MIYRILKVLCKLTIHSYFRRVQIIGKENIPTKGPYIFIANHPSAFMDPIVVATTVSPPVYFIAAGEYVGRGFKGWFFRQFLHMIPVFRPSTRPEDVHKNAEMFTHCFKHLGSKKSLLIFPEGVSITEKKIKPLKTGIARIARSAEIENNFSLNISIVPIGLNYSDPHQFRSDLFIKIGEPILVNDVISNQPEKEIEEVDKLTQLCEERLQETVIHIEEEEDNYILTALNTIYSRDIKTEFGFTFRQQEREFELHKELQDALTFFKNNHPQKFSDVLAELTAYDQTLKANHISDKAIKEIKSQISFRRIGTYIFGFPFFLFGWLTNTIPYILVNLILKKIKVNENFRGSLQLAFGLFIFLFFYASYTTIGIFSPFGWWALLAPILFYSSGIYSLIYLTAIRYSSKRNKLRKFLKSNKALLSQLIVQRKNLILNLENCRVEYQAKNNKA